MSTSDRDAPPPRRSPGKESLIQPLPKRFYEAVTVEGHALGAEQAAAPHPNPLPLKKGERGLWRLLLDGRPVRTPKRRALELPSRRLADAIAGEWAAQAETIDPAAMPLTTLANTALDAVLGREPQVAADVVAYAGCDLLCYRAEAPAALAERQSAAWDPLLDWAAATLGARLVTARGLMPVAQPEPSLQAIAAAVRPLDALRLSALHVMTTLTGSALLALAHARGRLTAQAAWTAAHIDEDWQIEQWGPDQEATARRARRWSEMQAASRMLELLGAN